MPGKIKRSLSLIFAVVFVLPFSANAKLDVKKIEQSKTELKSKKAELNKKLSEASNKVREDAKEMKSTQDKISSCQQEIDACNRYINFYDNEILKMESQIETINEDIDQKKTKLKKCLKSIYMAGDTSTLDIVLGAKDFNDFLDKADVVRSVSTTIQKLIDGLNDDIDSINQKKEEISSHKKEQEKLKTTLESSRANLEVLYRQNEQELSKSQSEEKAAKQAIDENDAESRAIDEQIRRYYEEERRRIREQEEARRKALAQKNQTNNNNQPVAPITPVAKGKYVWPAPGYSKITTVFGECNDGVHTHPHGGIDIAGSGVYGANVVAANSGRVILAHNGNSGYGNYIIIDHGNNICTLYGHLSCISVLTGQTVTAGQKIGNVGSTGKSTGPHLHFEVRKDGQKINPRVFV